MNPSKTYEHYLDYRISFSFACMSFYLSLSFWLCWVVAAVWVVPQLQRARATPRCGAQGFSGRWLLLLQSVGSRALGLQQPQLPGSRAQAQRLWGTGLVAPQHVGSSRTRDGTHVSCISRPTLHY